MPQRACGRSLPYQSNQLTEVYDGPKILATRRRAFLRSVETLEKRIDARLIRRTSGVAAASLGGRLTDESQIVRVLSAVALGKIGPEAQTAIPALTAALHDEDQFVRERAAEALEKIRKSVEAR